MSNESDAKKVLQSAKELALMGIVPECRDVAKKFFQCLEDNLNPYDKKGKLLTYQQLEYELNKHVIPMCMEKYNLEACLKKYDKFYGQGKGDQKL